MSRLERIVAACGGILMDAGTRALIPGPGHSHKDRSVSLVETEDGRILIHCFSPKDDWRAVRRALADKGLLDCDAPEHAPDRRQWSSPEIAAQPSNEERLARAQRIWTESAPIRWTPATIYLRRRAIPESFWQTETLRFHPRMTSIDDRARRPTLVAAISGADGCLQGVQVTLLTPHGTAKASVATPRRTIGRLMGGAVRLAPLGETLVIAEGVESALSASAALSLPAWALLSAYNLALFEPPADLDRLLVAADNDEAGERAVETLRGRLHGRLSLEVVAPPRAANDWNDAARLAKI